jgi:hypothetical protein
MISAFMALASGSQVEVGPLPAKRPIAPNLPAGANLYVVPMEWNLDALLRAEMRRNKLPVHLVERQEDADFIMTASSVKLSSRMLSPSRDFHVRVVSADGATQVWSAEASDYATFFGRFRSHGAVRAAKSIVRKLRNRFFKPPRGRI